MTATTHSTVIVEGADDYLCAPPPEASRLPRYDPIRALLAAYFEQGALDFLGGAPRHRRDAEQWFDSDSVVPFSFTWTCEHLGFDASRTRDRCRNLRFRGVRDLKVLRENMHELTINRAEIR